jgi:hypothetical protein
VQFGFSAAQVGFCPFQFITHDFPLSSASGPYRSLPSQYNEQC